MMARWLRRLIGRRRAEAEARDELAFHLEMETRRSLDAGLTPDEARRRARRDLGSAEAVRDAVRDARATWLDVGSQDIRAGAAALRRAPAFAAMAALVLGLGIGVNIAVFSLVDAVFFAPPRVDQPGTLAYAYQRLPTSQLFINSFFDLEFFRQHNDIFSAMTAHWGLPLPILIGGEAMSVRGEIVTANYFDVLGVKPARGRTFGSAEDDLSTTQRAMVISHDLWIRRFNGTRDVLGTTVRLKDAVWTIVGVMPPGFHGLSDPWAPSDCWVTAAQIYGDDYRLYGTGIIGRLKPGVTLAQAQAGIAVENEALHRELEARWSSMPGYVSSGTPRVNPAVLLPIATVRTPFLPDSVVIPIRLATAVAVVVALVLLVAATNIAGLLSARGVVRVQEIAVRRALGAGAARLLRQFAAEGVMLAAAGGAVGLVLAVWLLSAYRAYTPERYVVLASLNARGLAFTCALSLIVGVFVNVAPALQALRVNVVAALTGANGPTARTRRWLRHGVVVPQVAASLLLLVVAGAHLRGLAPLELARLGYEAKDVGVLSIGVTDPAGARLRRPTPQSEKQRAERARRFLRVLTTRLESRSGTEAVVLTDYLPTDDRGQDLSTMLSHDAFVTGTGDSVFAATTGVSAGYFRMLDIPLREGRDFDRRDVREAPHVAIVSQTVANRLWHGRSPIGRQLASVNPARPPTDIDWLTVVGVAGDTAAVLRPDVPVPSIYLPLSQQWRPSVSNLIARTHGPVVSGLGGLQAAVTGSDPLATIWRTRLMTQIADEQLYSRRAAAGILTASGCVGLFLAALGLYGVVRYAVAQRMREIAIRMTVGADRRDVLALVLREGMVVTAAGAAVGVPLALFGLHATANLVGTTARVDGLVLLAVLAFVTLVVFAACYLPARRAANSDPAVVLRRP